VGPRLQRGEGELRRLRRFPLARLTPQDRQRPFALGVSAGLLQQFEDLRRLHRGQGRRRGRSRPHRPNDHQESVHFDPPTEKVRAILLTLPPLSLTDTVNVPFFRSVIGVFSASSQTPLLFVTSSEARSVPALWPSISKSATTEKLFRSTPVS